MFRALYLNGWHVGCSMMWYPLHFIEVFNISGYFPLEDLKWLVVRPLE